MDLEETTFRVIDTETTSKDPEKAGVCEVAAVNLVHDGVDWAMEPHLDELTHPGEPIPPEASAIHHIVDEDVAFQRPVEDYKPALFDDGAFPVAHNAAYDAQVLGHSPFSWICTFRLARRYLPEAPGHSNQVLRYYLGLDISESEIGMPHRALADAVVTAGILLYLLKYHVTVTSVDELITLSHSPVELRGRVGFGKYADLTWDKVPDDYLNWMSRQKSWDADIRHTINEQIARRRPQ